MPSLKITNQCQLSPQECFQRVTKLLNEDPQLRKLDAGYKCEFDPILLSGQAVGRQFKANLKVLAHGDGSLIELIVELPFHLALAKGLVQKTLTEKLSQAVSSSYKKS